MVVVGVVMVGYLSSAGTYSVPNKYYSCTTLMGRCGVLSFHREGN